MIETDNNAYRAQLITPYAYEMPFDFWSANDIQVWVTKNGVDTQLDPTEFMVFRNQVKLKSATYAEYSDYDSITFLRVVDPTQTTDYANGMNINAEVLERSLDKLTAITQQLSEVIQRCVKFSVSETGSDVTLPAVVGRANSLLGFGPDGNTMVVRSIEQLDQDIAEVEADAEYVRSKISEFLVSEGYAVGQQNGVDVGPDSPYYHNNSKYYAEALPPMVTSKADKVVPTAAGNLATLDANGNLQDSEIGSAVIGEIQGDVSDLQDDVSDLQTNKANVSYVNGMKLTKVWQNPNTSASNPLGVIDLGRIAQELVIEYRETSADVRTSFRHIKSTYTGTDAPNGFTLSRIRVEEVTSISRAMRIDCLNFDVYTDSSTKISFKKGLACTLNNDGNVLWSTDTGNYLTPIAVYAVGDIYNTQGA